MTLFLIIIFTLVGSVLSLIGGVLLLLRKKWTKDFAAKLVNFSAGVLLTTAFLHLFPEAHHQAGEKDIFLPAFVAMVLFFFLERFLFWFHHHHDSHGIKPSVYLIILGDTVHNFIDGIAIAVTFLVSIPLGITTSIAVAVHEIPQEIADFTILLSQGLSKKKTLIFNFISSLAALIGAILAFSFSALLKEQIYLIISFTAGMFTYIAAADLIPELHRDYEKQSNWQQSIFFLLGIATVVLLGKVVG